MRSITSVVLVGETSRYSSSEGLHRRRDEIDLREKKADMRKTKIC